jgi:hypothetical protein
MPEDAPPNGGAPGPRARVLEMQTKLHRWTVADPGRRFDDLFNFVHDPATLLVALDRVAGNRGARTPGWESGDDARTSGAMCVEKVPLPIPMIRPPATATVALEERPSASTPTPARISALAAIRPGRPRRCWYLCRAWPCC